MKGKVKEVKEILARWKTDDTRESFSNIERCFELPQRTLENWLTGKSKPDEGALPLLKIIDTYPWLINVALKDYEETAAKKIMTIAGLEEMQVKLVKELAN